MVAERPQRAAGFLIGRADSPIADLNRRGCRLSRCRQQQRGGRAGGGIFGGGASGFNLAGLGAGFAGPAAPAPENDPLRLDADKIVATLTGRAEQARLEAPGDQASRPVATWDWPAVAAVVIPGLALLIAALA